MRLHILSCRALPLGAGKVAEAGSVTSPRQAKARSRAALFRGSGAGSCDTGVLCLDTDCAGRSVRRSSAHPGSQPAFAASWAR